MTRSLLQQTMDRWLRESVRWGESDCVISCGDWVGEVLGRDVVGDWRYSYDDFGSCQLRTKFFTQPLRVTSRVMEKVAGLSRTASPVRGDVAVFKRLRPDGRVLPVAGVCILPGLFGCRVDPDSEVRGLVQARPLELLAAWAVGYDDG